MQSEEAYEAIRDAIESDAAKRSVRAMFDQRHFGSFLISFEANGQARCVVNDRGCVVMTDDAQGTGRSIATVPSLLDVDRQTLLRTLGL